VPFLPSLKPIIIIDARLRTLDSAMGKGHSVCLFVRLSVCDLRLNGSRYRNTCRNIRPNDVSGFLTSNSDSRHFRGSAFTPEARTIALREKANILPIICNDTRTVKDRMQLIISLIRVSYGLSIGTKILE